MADPIKLYDVMFPPSRIRVRPENLLQLKNHDYERLLVKNLMWYSSLIDDLRLISIDASTGDEDADARLLHNVNSLILRAEHERIEIENMIHRAYLDTSPTDTLALNSVRRLRQDRIVEWQRLSGLVAITCQLDFIIRAAGEYLHILIPAAWRVDQACGSFAKMCRC